MLRTCGWLALTLFAAAYAAWQLPGKPIGPPVAHLEGWRRTADGWERRAAWGPAQVAFEPQVHPLAVLSFSALISLAGSFAFAPAMQRCVVRVSPPPWHIESRRPAVQRVAARQRR